MLWNLSEYEVNVYKALLNSDELASYSAKKSFELSYYLCQTSQLTGENPSLRQETQEMHVASLGEEYPQE